MCPNLSEKLRGCQHHELEETHVYTGPGTGRVLYSCGVANCSTSFSCLLSETDIVQLHHHGHSGHEQSNGSEEGLSQTWNLGFTSPQLQRKLLPRTNQVTLAERACKKDLTLALSYSCICASPKPQEGSTGMGAFWDALARTQLAPVPQGNFSPTRQQRFPAPPAFPMLAVCSGSAVPAARQRQSMWDA